MHGAKTYSLNDWKKILVAQNEYIHSQEQAEKSFQVQAKTTYKSILDDQIKQKDNRKQNEAKIKEKDALNVYSSLNDYIQFEKNKNSEKNILKSQLYQKLTEQVEQKKKLQATKSFSELALEKKILDSDQSLLIKLETQEKNKKLQKNHSEIEFLELKKAQKNQESLSKSAHREWEKELVQYNIKNFERYKNNHRNVIEGIREKQETNYKHFLKVAEEKNKEDFRKIELVNKWEEEHLKKIDNHYESEVKRKQIIKEEENYGLQFQLHEKFKRKQEEKTNLEKEKEFMDISYYGDIIQEKKRKFEERKMKENYKKILDYQTQEKEIERMKKNLFNEREREINKQIIENLGNNEFKGIPGVHKSVSPLRSALSVNDSKFFTSGILKNERNDLSWRNTEKRQRTKNVSFQKDYSEKHNTITNPIGEVSPVILKKSFHRGRGLSSLRQ